MQQTINNGSATYGQMPQKPPLAKREEAEIIIKEIKKDKVIETFNSLWPLPIVFVEEKCRSTCFFCVN